MKFEVDTKLFPFSSNFLETSDGSNLHYIDEGQGTVLLMLHGNPTWSFSYRKVIHSLSKHFRCIAPDYPGFGLSVASKNYRFLPGDHTKAITELVEHLKLDSFILIMQDWGGPIGLTLALNEPGRVKGIVLGNTWAWPLKGNLGVELFSKLMGGSFGRFHARHFNGVWRFFMRKGFTHKLSKQEKAMYKAPFLEKASREPTSIFPRQLTQAYQFELNLQLNLHSLKYKPTLLLWGMNDFAFKSPELHRFMKTFPNYTYHPLKAGHFWQDDQGELAAKYIHSWLTKER